MSGQSVQPVRLRSPRPSSDAALDIEQHGTQRTRGLASPLHAGLRPLADGDRPAAEPPSGLRRLGSALWGSESKLLRHSSITVFDPTGEHQHTLFLLAGAEALQDLKTSPLCSRPLNPTGKWWHAMAMLVCADGAPFLLGLPAAMARLGWAAGLTVLAVAFGCILLAATRLVRLHEHGGKRHNRYRELAQVVLGELQRGKGRAELGGCAGRPWWLRRPLSSLCPRPWIARRQTAGRRGGADIPACRQRGHLHHIPGLLLPASVAASGICRP